LVRQAFVYSSSWFLNVNKNGKPADNTFELVGAGPISLNTDEGDYNGVTDAINENVSWVWLQDKTGNNIDVKEVRDTTNHEIAHQFQWPGDLTGHDMLEAHDGSDKCLMNAGDVLGRGKRNTMDDLYELSLDKIYSIRDYAKPI
jgi:hypothetical protein